MLLLLLLPAMLVSCGSIFQGPVIGSIQLERQSDAADAMAYLRCRGPGLHGDIRTDAEETRVNADGRFIFIGSFTFPTTERCYIEVFHPRYLKGHVDLKKSFSQTLPPLKLESWDAFFSAGPRQERSGQTRQRPWPYAELRRQIFDTYTWLKSFSISEQHDFVRYVSDVHRMYRDAVRHSGDEWRHSTKRNIVRIIGLIEEMTAFPYPIRDYVDAVNNGDAKRVQELIDGGVLQEAAWGRGTALYMAASSGHQDLVDVLLASGAPLSAEGCRAALLGALGEGQWDMALKLIGLGADINVFCRNKSDVGDVLTKWARAGNLQLMTSFFEAGVPVDMPNRHGITPLAEAVAAGRIEVVKKLLAAGADPDVRTADNVTLLDDAVAKGYLDIERALRSYQGAVDTQASTSADQGEIITLPWRRGLPMPYRVYSNYGQVTIMAADPIEPGTLWLGTQGGLLRVNPETGARRAWTRVNGLPSSAVRRLWFDGGGRYLWVATSGGLARLPLDDLDRVETVGDREPVSSFSSGFLTESNDGHVWYWANNHLYDLHAEAGEAVRYSPPEKQLSDMVAQPDGSGFFLVDGNHVWQIEPGHGKSTLILSAEDLAQLPLKGPTAQPELRYLSLDADKGYLWIGTWRHGVFRLELDTSVITQTSLDAEQLDNCARSKVDHHMHGQATVAGGAVYAQLERCFGRIDGDNHFEVLRDRIMAGPVADAGGDVWYVAEDSFHRIDGRGKTSRYSFLPDPIGTPRVTSLYVDDSKLFVGVDDAPLAVMDLQRRIFIPVSGVTDVQRLRRVAGRNDLLALGHKKYWWVDRDSLASDPLILRPPGAGLFRPPEWQDVRDLEYDGKAYWVLRDDRSRGIKSRIGLFRLTAQDVKYYKAAGGYSLGKLVTLAQDPEQSNLLWLVTTRDPLLVDFDKERVTSERLGKRTVPRRSRESIGKIFEDSSLCGLTLKRNQACDPDVAGLIWEMSGSGLVLRQGMKILHRWPAKLPTGTIAVTRTPDTIVWLGSKEGLIEFPIQESLGELLNTPKTAGTARSKPRR